MPAPSPLIETPRLILRVPALADLDRWTEMMADAETTRYIGGPAAPLNVWRTIMQFAGAWTLTGVSLFSVIEKESGLWIGRVGPWSPHGWPGTEVGWGLHPDAWGKGYAFEAACASMEYAFDTLDWTEAIHCIHPDNARSRRLAIRLGSTLRGHGRLPAPHDGDLVELWRQSRDEWRSRRHQPPDGGAAPRL